jgi:predicted  nucleic acid-binding Zn-ribbon protein
MATSHLFGKSQAATQEAPYPQLDSASLERRVRTLEEGLANLRKIVQVTEENILVKNRHVAAEFKTFTSDINELRREMQEMKEKMVMMLKEMQSLARQEDVKIIERYVNMWNPVRFVTQGEVEDLVKDLVGKHLVEQGDQRPSDQEEP